MKPLSPAVPANVVDDVQRRWPNRVPDWPRLVENELRDLCQRY